MASQQTHASPKIDSGNANFSTKALHTVGLGRGYHTKPYGLKWRSNTFLIIAIVAISLCTENFLYGLIVPILPYILGDRIGLPHEEWQKWVSILLAVFAGAGIVSGPIAGYLADLMGSRKLIWLTSLGVMFLSTVMFFHATTLAALVFSRVLMGAASASVWTIGMTLCMDTVGVKNLGKALATVFAAVNVGGLISPALGGILYEKVGLGACAAVCYGIIALDFLGRIILIEKRSAARYEEQSGDSHGSASPADDCVTQAEEARSATDGEDAPLLGRTTEDLDEFVLKPFSSSFLRKFPILYCFRFPAFLAAMFQHTTYAVVIASWDTTIPTHAIDVWGVNALQAGLMMLPLSIVALAVGPVGGWYTDKYGPKLAAVVGSIWLAVFLILLRIPQSEPRKTQIALYEVLLGIATVGISLINTPAHKVASGLVEKCHKRNPDLFGPNGPYASLYGLFNVCFSTGLAIGPLICGALSVKVGYGNMNLVLSVWIAVTALTSFWFFGRPAKDELTPESADQA